MRSYQFWILCIALGGIIGQLFLLVYEMEMFLRYLHRHIN